MIETCTFNDGQPEPEAINRRKHFFCWFSGSGTRLSMCMFKKFQHQYVQVKTGLGAKRDHYVLIATRKLCSEAIQKAEV